MKAIFSSLAIFEDKIRLVFSTADKERAIERAIHQLK